MCERGCQLHEQPRRVGGRALEETVTVLGGHISIYINLCLMVAEVAVLAFGPRDHHRETLDTLAHILAGPSPSSDSSTAGSWIVFFFLSLWHFLCDSGEARPSLIRVCPTNWKGLGLFESLWLLIHHVYIGAFKLLDRPRGPAAERQH